MCKGQGHKGREVCDKVFKGIKGEALASNLKSVIKHRNWFIQERMLALVEK